MSYCTVDSQQRYLTRIRFSMYYFCFANDFEAHFTKLEGTFKVRQVLISAITFSRNGFPSLFTNVPRALPA